MNTAFVNKFRTGYLLNLRQRRRRTFWEETVGCNTRISHIKESSRKYLLLEYGFVTGLMKRCAVVKCSHCYDTLQTGLLERSLKYSVTVTGRRIMLEIYTRCRWNAVSFQCDRNRLTSKGTIGLSHRRQFKCNRNSVAVFSNAWPLWPARLPDSTPCVWIYFDRNAYEDCARVRRTTLKKLCGA
jgi:hypothetical protein